MSEQSTVETSGKMRIREIKPLNGIRALAARWVFSFHYRPYILLAFPFTAPFMPIMNVGYLGVDLFFMLSGYIITLVHGDEFSNRDKYSFSKVLRFLWLRIARIWPAMAVTVLAWGIYDVVLMWHRHDAGMQAVLIPLRLLRHLTMTQAWTAHSDDWNPVDWAVSSEWLAYLVWILVVAVLFRLRKAFSPKQLGVVAAVTLLPIIIVGLGMQDGTDLLWHDGTKIPGIQTLRVMCDFMAGAVLAIAWPRIRDVTKNRFLTNKIFAAPSFLAVIIVAVIYVSARFNLFWNPRYGQDWKIHKVGLLGSNESVVALLFILFLIPALAVGNDLFTRFLGSRVLVYAGRLSYSFYLFHWMPLSAFLILSGYFGWKPGGLEYGLGVVSAFLISIVGAYLLWKYIEEFFRIRLRKMIALR